MTTFYVDLAADFVNRSGADSTTNVATGIGGLLAVIFGRGAVTTAIAAGDTCYCKGTGRLNKLAALAVDDSTGWQIGDTVRNNIGSGDHWVGKIIYISGTTVHIQLDASPAATHATVNANKADGIENVTRTDTGTVSYAVPIGITFNNAGSVASGHIKFIGVEGTGWTVDGTRFCVQADGIGANYAITIASGNDYLWFQHMELDHPTYDGVYGQSGVSTGHVFWDVYVHDADTVGINGANRLSYCLFYRCLVENCGSYGVQRTNNSTFVACRFSNNGSGMSQITRNNYFGCVATSEGGIGIDLYLGSIAVNCVSDDCDGDGNVGFSTAGSAQAYAIGCRSTRHNETNQIGFQGSDAGPLVCIQCIGVNNTISFGQYTRQIESDETEEEDFGYVNAVGGDFNLSDTAEKRSVAVVIP